MCRSIACSGGGEQVHIPNVHGPVYQNCDSVARRYSSVINSVRKDIDLIINRTSSFILSFQPPIYLKMLKSFVAIAALASSLSFGAAQTAVLPAYPLTNVLPVPGYNSTTDGFNKLADLYSSSAAQLSAQAVSLGMLQTQ